MSRDELSFENVFAEGTLVFNRRKGGRSIEAQQLEITSASTVQDLIEFIRDSVGIQRPASDPGNPIPVSVNNITGDSTTLTPGAIVTADGRLRFVSNNGVDNAVTIGLSSFLITEPDGTISSPNLGFASVQSAKGQSAVADFLAFDSLGSPAVARRTVESKAVVFQASASLKIPLRQKNWGTEKFHWAAPLPWPHSVFNVSVSQYFCHSFAALFQTNWPTAREVGR